MADRQAGSGISRRTFLKRSGLGLAAMALPAGLKADDDRGGTPVPAARPNILWIVCEDINPHLGCFGDPDAVTPNLDRFAKNALRYTSCWSSAPVCAPARTALITGVYPTSTGSEHMRSIVKMPDFMKMYPQLLRKAGYYCTNNSKEDYNLKKPDDVWNASSGNAHWKNRPAGKPFMAVFNIECTHESQIRNQPHILKHDPSKVRLPAYHPDVPEIRRDWAQYHDRITEMDDRFSRLLAELEDAGLAEDTIVFFFGDNGSGMPRSKRCALNSGLNVPLIVRVPGKFKHLAPKEYKAGSATARVVEFVDFAPTLLSLAGVKPPEWIQGNAFMGPYDRPRAHIHGFRGRMDTRYDVVRSVRNERFIYVRNYTPHLIYGQHVAYMFETPTTRVWKKLYDDGKLKPPQTCFWERKAPEELYDLQADPDEVKNLAGSKEHSAVLQELRTAQKEHALLVRDVGFLPESEIHRRSKGTTPYEMGHDAARYPLERIIAMADAASLMLPDAVPQLISGLADTDSAVRYWAVTGILARGRDAAVPIEAKLRNMLGDESPAVRIAAAKCIGLIGGDANLKTAFATLRELVSPLKNGGAVATEALNAFGALGRDVDRLLEMLKPLQRTPDAAGKVDGKIMGLVDEMKL